MENYPILTEWLNTGLRDKWETYKHNIAHSYPKLSTIASGCYAARVLEREFNAEYETVYNYRAKKGDSPEFLDFIDNCNWKMEDENFRNDLVNWSGTRWAELDSEIDLYIDAAHGLEPDRITESKNTRIEYERKAKEIENNLRMEREEKERKYKEYLENKKHEEEEYNRIQSIRIDFWNKYHPGMRGRGSILPYEYFKQAIKDDIERGIIVPEIILRDYGII